MTARNRSLLALVALLALVVVACGSDPVVVSGPGIEPAGAGAQESGAVAEADSETESEVEAPEDFELTFDLGGGDDGSGDDAGQPDEPSTGDGEDEGAAGSLADIALLRQAATTTSSMESYRFELAFTMVISDPTFDLSIASDEPFTVGAVAGSRSWLRMDMQPIFDAVLDSLPASDAGAARSMFSGDLSMEVVTDGDVMYLRAPLFANMSALGALPPGLDFSALADGWGAIDISAATGLTSTQIAELTGAQTGASADVLLAMLQAAGSQVTDLGPADVRGVPTSHLRAVVSLADMVEAQGTSVDELQQMLGTSATLDVELPIDVYIDVEGRVRRITMTIDLDTIAELIDERPPPLTVMRMSSTIDFFDFGEAIDFVDPSTGPVTDLTDAFAAMISLGG